MAKFRIIKQGSLKIYQELQQSCSGGDGEATYIYTYTVVDGVHKMNRYSPVVISHYEKPGQEFQPGRAEWLRRLHDSFDLEERPYSE